MQYFLCPRCQFKVPANKHICQTCGYSVPSAKPVQAEAGGATDGATDGSKVRNLSKLFGFNSAKQKDAQREALG